MSDCFISPVISIIDFSLALISSSSFFWPCNRIFVPYSMVGLPPSS